ncbi:hypothetical protein VPG91_24200 [Nitrospirillum amazonense]|uniref:hypothetical protein n=1 Tax=Nitrospirillum amazonense TaxID=28077 RepID=UPI002DD441E8|nr:hypothetical protein [Nitrospirillum amazonense]MEC4594125.1 hypothetical protein [Nitrospirillum amazonense]
MTIDLKLHFVAFLDVLGFSEMVNSDVQNNKNDHLSKLFKCHQAASSIFSEAPDCSITQFSDSIVVAKPYDSEKFQWFVKCVAKYQRLLLDEGLLCRGGIAVNKHFSNGSFTFSAGLIDAYRVESTTARYPRVVISDEVLNLIYEDDRSIMYPNLIREDDGLFFIDYIGITSGERPKSLVETTKSIINQMKNNKIPSVREKGLWLASYVDSVLNTSLGTPKFSGKSVEKARLRREKK